MDKRKPSVTMYEIAREAGVSQSTVSRVFNGNAAVAPEKQAAVLEAMERLNYRPNLTAQGLVSGKTFTIGILTRHLGSPFFSEILRGIGQGIQDSSYNPVIGLGNDVLSQDLKALDLLLARRVDGLILQVSKRVSDDALRDLAKEIPVIIIGRQVPGLEGQCLVVKNRDGAYIATSYLIEKGHTHIAHVSGSLSVADSVERQDGYCQALRDHGLEVYPELMVEGDFSETTGVMAVERLLARRAKYPFTAIFAANDQMAFGIRLALYHRGIAVPDDVSLVGFDDMPGSQFMIPPLTTVRQPAYYMGLMASHAMLAMLANEGFHLPEFPLELISRQSVAMR